MPALIKNKNESVMEEVLGVSQGCVAAFALVNVAEKKVNSSIHQ